MSRYFNRVVLIYDSDFDILVFPLKAILATQFDAFEKGKLGSSKSIWSDNELRTLGPMSHSQLQSLLGVGVFNADGTSSLILLSCLPFFD